MTQGWQSSKERVEQLGRENAEKDALLKSKEQEDLEKEMMMSQTISRLREVGGCGI